MQEATSLTNQLNHSIVGSKVSFVWRFILYSYVIMHAPNSQLRVSAHWDLDLQSWLNTIHKTWKETNYHDNEVADEYTS